MDLLLHKTFIDGLELWVLLVDYCDVFISCLDSHSDGTHSLQRIYWWASAVMLNFTQSGLLKTQAHLHLGWPAGEQNFSKFSFLGELLFQHWTVFAWCWTVMSWWVMKSCIWVFQEWCRVRRPCRCVSWSFSLPEVRVHCSVFLIHSVIHILTCITLYWKNEVIFALDIFSKKIQIKPVSNGL